MTKYRILRDEKAISYVEFVNLLSSDATFREFHTELLAQSPFEVFRWETPAVTQSNQHNDYEFVLINSPGLARAPDPNAFREHFVKGKEAGGVVAFANLGRNAQMIVPCPTGDDSHYTHIASFIRGAPAQQVDRLWSMVGQEMQSAIGSSPRWLSTAGGGVAWLHVRIDTTPKYYSHGPYRSVSEPQG